MFDIVQPKHLFKPINGIIAAKIPYKIIIIPSGDPRDYFKFQIKFDRRSTRTLNISTILSRYMVNNYSGYSVNRV